MKKVGVAQSGERMKKGLHPSGEHRVINKYRESYNFINFDDRAIVEYH
jgi:hypothetical protein